MQNQVRHLGVIMDGNRRWAKQHMFRSAMKGHEKGIDMFIDCCKWCQEAGIPYLTVYAFSTENWNRTQEEVSGLFKLMKKFFTDKVDVCLERDIRMVIIGDRSRLDEEARETIRRTEEATGHCRSLTVQVAISYGGRDEIVRAAEKYAGDVRKGTEEPGKLTEEKFSEYLDTAGVPDIDMVIRTGGNRRLSNFFPWQTTYSEIWFTDTLWPDFTQEEFQKALDYYAQIQINKGK